MKTKLRALLTSGQNLFTATTKARTWARSHKAYVTIAVLAALHGLALLGLDLPARDIERAVSAIIGA